MANDDNTIGYGGNKIFKPLKMISKGISTKQISARVKDLHKNKEFWSHIIEINDTINFETHNYFKRISSRFVLLPLTTRMISSPGALYCKGHLDYSTDTVPIKLKWFDLNKEVFLSESSQIYLELQLILNNLKSVYCVYNSFRKEKSDFSHLSEFHHIEYEGKVTQEENKKIVLGWIRRNISKLLRNNIDDLSYFLFDDDIEYLKNLSSGKKVDEVTFEQALDILYRATKNPKYKKFSTQNFGAWEEIKLTSEFDNMVIISEFPLYEISFYHAPKIKNNKEVGENSDFIWPYYREFVGSGHRVRSFAELMLKSKKFHLPVKDYEPYVESRKLKGYEETSGFGIGWERFLQGLLKMPYIYSASLFPRIHSTIFP